MGDCTDYRCNWVRMADFPAADPACSTPRTLLYFAYGYPIHRKCARRTLRCHSRQGEAEAQVNCGGGPGGVGTELPHGTGTEGAPRAISPREASAVRDAQIGRASCRKRV